MRRNREKRKRHAEDKEMEEEEEEEECLPPRVGGNPEKVRLDIKT